jgi:hypothetical protein
MVDRKLVAQKQKIIVINKDISFSAGVRASQIEEEGVKCLQLIQALEGKGYRIKLNVYWMSRSGRELVGHRVCLKKPEERLSLVKVAFPIAHPSMLRRVGFKWMEKFPTMTENFNWGYGMPSGNMLRSLVDKKEILLPTFIPDVDTFIKELGL